MRGSKRQSQTTSLLRIFSRLGGQLNALPQSEQLGGTEASRWLACFAGYIVARMTLLNMTNIRDQSLTEMQ